MQKIDNFIFFRICTYKKQGEGYLYVPGSAASVEQLDWNIPAVSADLC